MAIICRIWRPLGKKAGWFAFTCIPAIAKFGNRGPKSPSAKCSPPKTPFWSTWIRMETGTSSAVAKGKLELFSSIERRVNPLNTWTLCAGKLRPFPQAKIRNFGCLPFPSQASGAIGSLSSLDPKAAAQALAKSARLSNRQADKQEFNDFMTPAGLCLCAKST